MAADIETRIANLLAKAEGTDNAHEAEAYMAKAEELMLKFGIERANLEARKPGHVQAEIVIRKITIANGHGYADAMTRIAHAVGPSFSLKTLQSNLSDGARVAWLIGHSNDVDDAETLLTSLLVQSRSQAIYWWKTEGKQADPYATDNDAWKHRREFIYAFASGVRSRLEETRNRVVEDAEAGTALVLVDRTDRVNRWVDDNIQTKAARRTSRQFGGAAASRAGHAAGRDSVSSKAVTR